MGLEDDVAGLEVQEQVVVGDRCEIEREKQQDQGRESGRLAAPVQEPDRELGRVAFRTPWGRMRGVATMSDAGASSRSGNEADGPTPPEPGGRMGIAAAYCVARRRRSIDI
jgi:hypothetical protein